MSNSWQPINSCTDPGLDDEITRELAYYVFITCLSQVAPGISGKAQQGVSQHQQQQVGILASSFMQR